MASSNFLDKTGLSHFYSKIKEMLQNKQDKLTAGNNIIITDNTVSAKRNVFTGKSSTAGSVAVKVVECPEWELVDGNIIIVKFANTNVEAGATSKAFAQKLYDRMKQLMDILGIDIKEQEVLLDEEIENLIEERQAARKAKNFARADEIRNLLTEQGIILEDTREGVRWKRA